jgi:hypothetical protein
MVPLIIIKMIEQLDNPQKATRAALLMVYGACN